MTDQPTLKIKIFAPFETYFDGEALSVSATNDTGPFDILPHHKNFISLLRPGALTVRQDGRPDFIMKISQGMIHVKKDQAIVFLDV